MKRRIVGLVVVLVLVAGGVGVVVGRASAQTTQETQVVNLDPAWGTFKGTRGDDLVFEDSKKTIYVIELQGHTDGNRNWVMEPRERIRITRKPS